MRDAVSPSIAAESAQLAKLNIGVAGKLLQQKDESMHPVFFVVGSSELPPIDEPLGYLFRDLHNRTSRETAADPVVASDGHSYERAAITQILQSTRRSPYVCLGSNTPTTTIFVESTAPT